MSATRFSPQVREEIVELIREGLTIKDAAIEAEIPYRTVRTWISRGRQAEEGPYSDFVEAIEAAQQEFGERETPMTERELRLALSRAARKGSVQAMKLYWKVI
jgi:transposase-like protein